MMQSDVFRGGCPTRLDWRENWLHGEIPEAVGQLTRLEYLDLGKNYLTSVPNAIAKLANLKQLLLKLGQVIRLLALAPFVGDDDLQAFFGNACGFVFLALEIIEETHPLAPLEHP